jgi:hypothetical protein
VTPHEIVIRLGRAFDVLIDDEFKTPPRLWTGEEDRFQKVTEIRIPFADQASAEAALREVTMSVRAVVDTGGEDYRPVVAGEVVVPAEIAPAPSAWRPVMKCLNCGRPVHKRPGTDSWTGFSAPFWTHFGYWQGRRCPGRLTGAEPGGEFTEEEYRTYVAAQVTGPAEENAGA